MKKLMIMLLLSVMSIIGVTTTYAFPTQTPVTKSGKKDMRYKANKVPLKKDGKKDMRFKSNNPNAGKKRK